MSSLIKLEFYALDLKAVNPFYGRIGSKSSNWQISTILIFNYFVNTNATMIDESIAKKLAQTNVDRICVSLDGPTAQIHDKSRGKSGTFELTKRGIINLMNCGIAVDGIITLTKYNVNYIPETLELMHELGIHEAAIMLLATVGNAKKNVRDCYLTYGELKQFILQMTDLKKTYDENVVSK